MHDTGDGGGPDETLNAGDDQRGVDLRLALAMTWPSQRRKNSVWPMVASGVSGWLFTGGAADGGCVGDYNANFIHDCIAIDSFF
jgi:hypothetical protein